MKAKIIMVVLIILLFLGLCSAVYFWYKEKNKPPVSKVEYITVEKVKEVEKIKKIPVPGPEKIITVDKEKIVEKIKMPDWFKANKEEQAIASGSIEPYKGKTNVVATINTKTGVGNIVAKQEPLSFLGLENDKELYAKVGYSTRRETQISVGGRWLFVRVGKIKIGGYAEGKTNFGYENNSTTGEASAGLMITY